MSSYLIGIDAGATKTLGVLWDKNGQEIKRVVKGFCNFNVDFLKSQKNLEKTIEELLFNLSGKIKIVIGTSGYSYFEDPLAYQTELAKKFQTRVVFKDDGYLALNSIDNPNDLPVVLLISGTGSIVYGKKKNNYYRFGGHGHLLGDQGSAYKLAISAFKEVIYELDNNLLLSSFSKLFLKTVGISTLEEIKQLVYKSEKGEIANFAKIVYGLAESDATAKKLVKQASFDLLEQTKAILRKMAVNGNFILALKGGLMENSKLLKADYLEKLSALNFKYQLSKNNRESVYGALKIGEWL